MKNKWRTWENQDEVNALISMVMDYLECRNSTDDEEKRAIMYRQICQQVNIMVEESSVELRAKLDNLRKALESVT